MNRQVQPIKKKICFVATSMMTIKSFLIGHLRRLDDIYDISVVTNTNQTGIMCNYGLNASLLSVKIRREISPLYDFITLFQLVRLFRKERFNIIHSITPKAGLLAMLAGILTSVPVRIHIFTGQIWATHTGFMGWVLKIMDKLLAICATHLLADSESQKLFLVTEGIVQENKIRVLANGSVNGADMNRFKPDKQIRKKIRHDLNIDDSVFVLLFVGRLKKEKGVLDLAMAFIRAFEHNVSAHLLFVGPDEEALKQCILNISHSSNRVRFIPYTDTPENYMVAADVLCLPSYREGFGSVIIEAAACGIPAIATRIYGITDAIEEGRTGVLYEVGNIDELTQHMRDMYTSVEKRQEMGKCARERVIRLYSSDLVTKAWLEYYQSIP